MEKVVHCFNCHRFGHIGKACLNHHGVSILEERTVKVRTRCAEKHKSDSSHFPTFLSILRKFRAYSITQKQKKTSNINQSVIMKFLLLNAQSFNTAKMG